MYKERLSKIIGANGEIVGSRFVYPCTIHGVLCKYIVGTYFQVYLRTVQYRLLGICKIGTYTVSIVVVLLLVFRCSFVDQDDISALICSFEIVFTRVGDFETAVLVFDEKCIASVLVPVVSFGANSGVVQWITCAMLRFYNRAD